MLERARLSADVPYTDKPEEAKHIHMSDEPDIELRSSSHDDGNDGDADVEQALLPTHEQGLRSSSDLNGLGGGKRSARQGRFAKALSHLSPRKWFSFRRRRTAEHRAEFEEPRRRGFWAIMRLIFNYPEPGMKLRKTSWLDALRGLAALEVFIFHYTGSWIQFFVMWGPEPENRPDAWWTMPFIRSIYASGNAAVCLFFSISGYVLTCRILKLIRQRRTDEVFTALSSAVMRRGIRLYVPIMATTFLLMNAQWFLGMPREIEYLFLDTYWEEAWRWFEYCIKSWMPLRYPDRFLELLNHYDGTISWTIPLEFYGSMITYFALLFTARVTSFGVRTAIFCLFIYMYWTKDEWYVIQFLVGAIYAEYQLVEEERQAKIASGALPPIPRWRVIFFKFAAVGSLIFGYYVFGVPGVRFRTGPTVIHNRVLMDRPGFDWLFAVPKLFSWYDNRQFDRYYQCLGANFILVSIGQLPSVQRFLDTRPLQYLGRVSFGLYLCHIWVKACLRPLEAVLLNMVGLDGNAGPGGQPAGWRFAIAYNVRIFVIALPINLFVAGQFERFLDTPSVKLAKKFEMFVLRWGGWENGAEGNKPIELQTPAVPPAGAEEMTVVGNGSLVHDYRPVAVNEPTT